MSVEQHCAKEQHKPLCSPVEDCKISFLFLFFYPRESHTGFKWYNFFLKPRSSPFLLIFYCHAFRDLCCSSQALVALAPPQVPYLEQAAAHVVGGCTEMESGTERQLTESKSLFSLTNGQKWPHTECKGNTCLPTAVSHRSISLSHSLPFPLLIRVLSFHCTLPFFFSESQVFQMSQDTSMSEKPGVVVTDTSLSLKNPAPWEAVSISLSTRNCLP